MAMVARRLGLSVLLIERGMHPRFAIGESTSPLTNLLLEQVAKHYNLPRLLPLTTYGAWQRVYPQIVCGLKRGFTYYSHDAGSPFTPRSDRQNQLLVAASPNDMVSDMHWFRADVDEFLMQEAVREGAEYHDETEATLEQIGDSGATLRLTRRGRTCEIMARLLIDATGPRGFLNRALKLPESQFADLPGTQTLFSHFSDVRLTASMPAFASDDRQPYPPDDAALHHTFDGGWMWVLRFNNGITSAGVSVTDAFAKEIGLADGEPAWRRILERFPTVGEQFRGFVPVRRFDYWPRLSFRSSRAAGPGWIMLPSAAAFVDPLFSTGFPLTLLGIERLGAILETEWQRADLIGRLQEYGTLTLSDADWTARFVGGCFAAMAHFPLFSAYSMYYFAAASFSEMARRMNRRHLAARFLMQDRSDFASGLREGARLLLNGEVAMSPTAISAFTQKVGLAIEAINIAGVCDPVKRNWYDVDFNDVVANAARLEQTPEAVRNLLDEMMQCAFK